MVRTFQYKYDLEPLTHWAVNRYQATGTQEPPEPFPAWIKMVLPKWCTRFGYWVGVVTPDTKLDGDWVDRYPHTHINSMGWPANTTTALLYLSAPEIGGEIAIGGRKSSDQYTLIMPKPGLTVLTDAATWHGVKPVVKGTRIALITTGWEV